MTPLQTIREAVVKAIPEVMELKFGCMVKHKGTKNIWRAYKRYAWGSHTNTFFYFTDKFDPQEGETDDFEILGRDITLADILLTLNKKSGEYFVNTRGHFYTASAVRPLTLTDGHWNLSLPLDSQSPETLQFLAEILK